MLETVHVKQLNCLLRSEDISLILKHFSLTIQQRLEEIDRTHNFFTCLNSNNYEKSQLETQILDKYQTYKTNNHNEIKLIERFTARIIQIFDFFKQKSNYPHEMIEIQHKIQQKIKQLLKNQINIQFFVNNRPKTQKINHIRTVPSRSIIKANNEEQLSITPTTLNPTKQKQISSSLYCKKKNILDLNYAHNNFILPCNNKKTKTQNCQRQIDIGQIFKYVFSILKKGYLMKLKMQEKRNQKHNRNNIKDPNSIHNSDSFILIEGTGAILRSYSQKCKQNQNDLITGSQMKDKLISILSPNPLNDKNNFNSLNNITNNIELEGKKSKNQPFLKKLKARSILQKYESSSGFSSSIKKPNSKIQIREVDRKLNLLNEVLDLDKYFTLRSLKQPQNCLKQMLKRNNSIQNEHKKYKLEHNDWKSRINIQQSAQISNQTDPFNQQTIQNNINEDQTRNNFKIQIMDFQMVDFIHHSRGCDLLQSQNGNNKTQEIVNENNQYNDELTLQSIVCQSRNNLLNILADKSQNLIQKSKSQKDIQQQFTISKPNQFHLNIQQQNSYYLPIDQNSVKTNNKQQINSFQSNNKSKKHVIDSSIISPNEDIDIFIPLLPRKSKEASDENCSTDEQENKLNGISIKRKNLHSNVHPTNRCRVYRQKRLVHKSIMILNPINFNKQPANMYQQNNFIHPLINNFNNNRLKNSLL